MGDDNLGVIRLARTKSVPVPVRRRLSASARRDLIDAAATEVFGERGYHGASIDEIARRSGVTVPVVYDHFSSKRELYQGLIERHYQQLRLIWYEHAGSGKQPEVWILGAINAWFAYVETHPFAGRMLFRDTTGDPQIAAAHRTIQDASRDELLPLLKRIAGPHLAADDPLALELAWEMLRCALQGLALWWYDHADVPRETIVASAMNSTWIGLERFLQGEAWRP